MLVAVCWKRDACASRATARSCEIGPGERVSPGSCEPHGYRARAVQTVEQPILATIIGAAAYPVIAGLYIRHRILDAPRVRAGVSWTWRNVLAAAALVAAVGEAVDTISVGWPGLVFAALFAIGFVLILRGGRVGVVLVGVLMLLEVVFWPSYSRDTTTDWVVQTLFLVLGSIGVVLAAGLLWTSRTRTPAA